MRHTFINIIIYIKLIMRLWLKYCIIIFQSTPENIIYILPTFFRIKTHYKYDLTFSYRSLKAWDSSTMMSKWYTMAYVQNLSISIRLGHGNFQDLTSVYLMQISRTIPWVFDQYVWFPCRLLCLFVFKSTTSVSLFA